MDAQKSFLNTLGHLAVRFHTNTHITTFKCVVALCFGVRIF